MGSENEASEKPTTEARSRKAGTTYAHHVASNPRVWSMVTVTLSPMANDELVGMSRVLVFDSANPHLLCAAQAAQAEVDSIWTVTNPDLTAVTIPGCSINVDFRPS